MASRQFTLGETAPKSASTHQLENPFHEQDYKASYDNLIDEYASPYGATVKHQTFNVSTSPSQSTQHRRGPSLHRPKHSQSFSKLSDEASEQSHYAYPPPPPAKEVETQSFWQRVLPDSLACKLYVATVLLETIIDLAIEAELLVRVNSTYSDDSRKQSDLKMPVYLSIFALAHVFQLGLAIDAVFSRNTLQFIFLTIFNAAFLMYAIIQINEVRAVVRDATAGISNINVDVLTVIIPIVIGVAEIAYIGLGWKIYNEFGWKVYKFLGANRIIKKMYASYQIFECLVKFDVFFWVGFSVQFIWLVLDRGDWEYYITCAALPLSIVLLVEGHLAARYENKWMMATFMSGCVGALVYFVYKLVKVLRFRNEEEFRQVYASLTVFSVLAIVLLLATFASAVIVMRNFGRGLKDALAKKPAFSFKGEHNRAASTHLNRMSID